MKCSHCIIVTQAFNTRIETLFVSYKYFLYHSLIWKVLFETTENIWIVFKTSFTWTSLELSKVRNTPPRSAATATQPQQHSHISPDNDLFLNLIQHRPWTTCVYTLEAHAALYCHTCVMGSMGTQHPMLRTMNRECQGSGGLWIEDLTPRIWPTAVLISNSMSVSHSQPGNRGKVTEMFCRAASATLRCFFVLEEIYEFSFHSVFCWGPWVTLCRLLKNTRGTQQATESFDWQGLHWFFIHFCTLIFVAL